MRTAWLESYIGKISIIASDTSRSTKRNEFQLKKKKKQRADSYSLLKRPILKRSVGADKTRLHTILGTDIIPGYIQDDIECLFVCTEYILGVRGGSRVKYLFV